jgi:cytochrome c-type biogenesis protein CcmH
MITFWIAAALLSALVALPVIAGAARGAKATAADEDPTLALHRRQLAEIDDLAARGLLSEDDSRIARAEAGRRLLAAAEGRPAASVEPRLKRLAIAAAFAAPLIGLGLYLAVGSPRTPDQPFARRLAAWRNAEPTNLRPDEMAAVLEMIGRERPTDPEAPRNLAIVRRATGDFAGAVVALRRAVNLAPERADLWSELGETQVMQAEGVVSDDARTAFQRAIALQPDAPGPRYYLARRQIADGQTAEGLAGWRSLLAQLAPGPNRDLLEREIAAVAATGRLPADNPPPAAEPQVTGEQIAAMVDGLAARLASNPDDPEGWVRLVRAYTVMGQTAKRDAALAEARARYKNNPEVLRGLDSAAQAPQ